MAAKQILRQISMNSDKKKLSPHLTCGEMSPHDRFYFTFLHMTWFFSLFTMRRPISNWTFVMWRHFSTWQSVTWKKFLHMTNFFSTTTGCDGCDKYQVWGLVNTLTLELLRANSMKSSLKPSFVKKIQTDILKLSKAHGTCWSSLGHPRFYPSGPTPYPSPRYGCSPAPACETSQLARD